MSKLGPQLSINLKYEYATQHTKKEKHKCRDKESATFIKLICLKYHFYKSICQCFKSSGKIVAILNLLLTFPCIRNLKEYTE